MEARRWHEVESIELTQWTKRFLKYAKSLPPSAIKRISGKSIAQVLFGTSALRHSAVHRLPTSAAGTLNMIHAAMTFAEALNDPKRVERVEEIKTQLEASIDEIVQHQNLLERKLKEQLEDIARRRAELEELERSSIEEMLATDKEQRTAVGSALESFLFGSQQISNPCACNHTPSFDEAKAGSEAEHNMESSGTGMFHVVSFQSLSHLCLDLFLTVPPEHEPKLEPKLPETINEAQACDQSPLGEGEPHQLEELKEDIQPHQPEELKEDIPPHQPEELKEDIPPPWYDNNDGGIEEKPEVSALTLSTLSSKAKGKKDKKKGKVAASAWDVPAIEEDVIQPPWHENNDGGIEEKPEVSELTLSTLSSKGKDPKNKKKGKMAAFVWGIPAIEEDVIQPPWHENNDGGIEEKPEVSELTLSTLSSKGKSSKGKDSKNKKKGKVAASAWDIPAVEEQVTQPSWHDNNGGDVEEKPEVSVTLSTLKSIGKDPKNKKKGKGKGKVAASAWDIPAAEEAPVLVDEAPAPEEASPAPEHVYWRLPRYGAWNFGATRDVPAEPQNVVGESIQPEEPCPAASEEPSQPDEPYSIAAVEAPEPEDAFTARESVYNEDPMAAEIPASDATPEPSQAELVPKVSDDTEEHTLNQYDNVVHDLVDSYALAPAPDDAPMPGPPAEPTEFMAPPPKPALSAVRDELDLNHPRTPSAPPSTKTSVFEAAAAPEEAPTEDSHTITLKILHGSKVLRSIVFIKACTRTAILNEARAYCVKYARDDQSLATLLAKGYDLALMSMKMYGYDTDLSTYKVENLSSLVRAIEKTGIPRFTLRISEV